MANQEHLDILKQGVEVWNKWREENPKIIPDLEELVSTELSGGSITFDGFNFDNVNFVNCDLLGVRIINSTLKNAVFVSAKLAWLEQTSPTNPYPDHEKERFHLYMGKKEYFEFLIPGPIIINSNLSGAKFEDANLTGAEFENCILIDADFQSAILVNTKLKDTNLSGCGFKGTIFKGAKLKNVNFTNAYLARTTFSFCNLSSCKGINSVIVSRSCSIDFETLQKSKNLPKEFLLKIGLPENYINQLPNLFEDKGLKLFSVFISHSWANKDFARKLYDALISKGVTVFFDEKNMNPGDDIIEKITEGIEDFDKMILACSKESLDSWWVEEEIDRILSKERQHGKGKKKKEKLLIPIKIDNHIHDWGNGRAVSITKRVIGDFTEWQDEAKFEQSLKQLIEALNVDRGNNNIISHL